MGEGVFNILFNMDGFIKTLGQSDYDFFFSNSPHLMRVRIGEKLTFVNFEKSSLNRVQKGQNRLN